MQLTIKLPRLFETIDDLANLPVHRGHHPRVNFHTPARHPLALGIQAVPIRDFRSDYIVRFDIGRNETLVFEPLKTFEAQSVGTGVVSSFVGVPILGGTLKRPVRRGEGQVSEEWLSGLLLVPIVEVLEQVIHVECRAIKAVIVVVRIGSAAEPSGIRAVIAQGRVNDR
jgi:hypothetical protein